MSKVRSVRATEDRWVVWAEAAAAEGKTLNGWVTDACDLVAERDLAELRRARELAVERDRVRGLMRGE